MGIEISILEDKNAVLVTVDLHEIRKFKKMVEDEYWVKSVVQYTPYTLKVNIKTYCYNDIDYDTIKCILLSIYRSLTNPTNVINELPSIEFPEKFKLQLWLKSDKVDVFINSNYHKSLISVLKQQSWVRSVKFASEIMVQVILNPTFIYTEQEITVALNQICDYVLNNNEV